MRNSKGITLIALVITIIILIILAGVAINLTLGENGILKRTEEAKLKYEIAQAKEELDLKIAELQVEKQGSATLQDVVDMLKEDSDMDYIVSLEEIASITGVETIGDVDEIYVVYKIYQFRVDDRLQTEFISIVESYSADVAISSTLKSHDGKNADEKYTATYEIKVESKGQVESIEIETIDGKVTEEPTSLPYTKEIQVEIGQKYIVKVTTPDGKYKRYVIEEKAEETIKTAQELAAFRDKVNSGLTYEGKTVTLANDIDLSSVCGESIGTWQSIGTSENCFKGIFDGNNKRIINIYLSSNSDLVNGLFSYNDGTIKDIVIEDAKVNCYLNVNDWGTTMTGVLVGKNLTNGIIEGVVTKSGEIGTAAQYIKSGNFGAICGKNYGTITKCMNQIDIYNEWPSTAGICGWNLGKVELCVNKSNLNSRQAHLAGIVGCNEKTVENCYNIGNINISGFADAGGIVGVQINGGTITNCYSVGTVTASSYVGNIVGENRTGEVINCPETNITASALGAAFIDDLQDGNHLNNGYPILRWQIGE